MHTEPSRTPMGDQQEPLPIDPRNRRQLARLITQVENDPRAAATILPPLWSRIGQAHRIGITGPPGVGKSTLVDQLVVKARSEGYTVAVVAVDPSSPFSGGAILGDRVRMLRHSGDSGVFIRSMAARDHLGGLAASTRDVAHLLDAFGFDLILLETVGVGQSELDIMRAVDTVIVITVPGLGDSIQMLKAGVLEIADLFVVNKADRPGARETGIQLQEMLHLTPRPSQWQVPVLRTVASQGDGVEALWQAILRHRQHLQDSDELRERRSRQVEREVLGMVEAALIKHLQHRLQEQTSLGEILSQACQGRLAPHLAAQIILQRFLEEPHQP